MAAHLDERPAIADAHHDRTTVIDDANSVTPQGEFPLPNFLREMGLPQTVLRTQITAIMIRGKRRHFQLPTDR